MENGNRGYIVSTSTSILKICRYMSFIHKALVAFLGHVSISALHEDDDNTVQKNTMWYV